MARNPDTEKTDLERCAERIRAILEEYNCKLLDPDEGYHVLLLDRDTGEMRNVYR